MNGLRNGHAEKRIFTARVGPAHVKVLATKIDGGYVVTYIGSERVFSEILAEHELTVWLHNLGRGGVYELVGDRWSQVDGDRRYHRSGRPVVKQKVRYRYEEMTEAEIARDPHLQETT